MAGSVTPQVTEWDAQGNPITPGASTSASAPSGSGSGVTEWDAQGNPVQSQPQSTSQDSSISIFGMPLWTANDEDEAKGFLKGAQQTVGTIDNLVDKAGNAIHSGLGDWLTTPLVGDHAKQPGQTQALASQNYRDHEQQNSQPLNDSQQDGANVEAIAEFMLGDEALKGLSVSQRLSETSKLAQFVEKYPRLANVLGSAIRGGTVGAVVGGDHGGDSGAVTGAVTGALGGGANAALESIGGAKGAYDALTSGDADNPSIVQQITKGADVAQPPAQSAVRNALTASAQDAGTATPNVLDGIQNNPIMQNGSTILDDHLNALRNMEKDAYSQVDNTVGFDLKAEKAQLSNDQYKLKQLGNTEADAAQRKSLQSAINDSQQRIAAAQQKLTDAGIDPQAADELHQQRMAGMDFKKVLVRSSAPDGSVNIDRLLNQSKALRFTKYGDRLSQFFGSTDAADQYMSQLQQAQQMGIHAVKAQNIAKLLGKWSLGVIGLGAAGHVAGSILAK